MTVEVQPFKKLVPHKSKVSASEYNRLTALVYKIAKSLMTRGLMDSTGFHTRPAPPDKAYASKIFEIQSAAIGDGVYNCYEVVFDATQ